MQTLQSIAQLLAIDLFNEASAIQKANPDKYADVESEYGGPGFLNDHAELVAWCKENPQQSVDALNDLRSIDLATGTTTDDAEADLTRLNDILVKHGGRGVMQAIRQMAARGPCPNADEIEVAHAPDPKDYSPPNGTMSLWLGVTFQPKETDQDMDAWMAYTEDPDFVKDLESTLAGMLGPNVSVNVDEICDPEEE